MLHACIGMPTFSCLPACTATCTPPNSCPGLGKIPCVTPAPYYSPQAFPYPATETARGARPCATKANTHQRASYPWRKKRHAGARPNGKDAFFVLLVHASRIKHVHICSRSFLCCHGWSATRYEPSAEAFRRVSPPACPTVALAHNRASCLPCNICSTAYPN